MSDKEAVIEAIRELPETATVEEISEEVAILVALRRAKEASEAGRIIPHERITGKGPGHWFEVYMQCPHPFEVPPRRKQFCRRSHKLAG